jgi:hypothetical protein
MDYSLHVALTSGEDSAYALEGSSPVRAYKKELPAAPFLFSATVVFSPVSCHDGFPSEIYPGSQG